MRDVLKLITPPEWSGWGFLAKLAYVVIFVGIMTPVALFARWLSSALFGSPP